MLQSFREHIKGWVAGVIFVIISLSFLLWGVQYYMQARASADRVVAKVGGQEIKLNLVNQKFQQYQMKEGFVASKQKRQQIKEAILNQLVGQVMFQQGIRSAGYVGSPNQVQESIVFSTFVAPFEIKLAEQAVLQHSHIGYITIPLSHVSPHIHISKQQIAEYYENNKDMFRTPARLKLAYLKFSPSRIEKSIVVSDESAQEYYQANIQNYSKPKSWLVERLVVPIDANDKTVTQAKQLKILRSTLTKNKDFYAISHDHPKWHLGHQRITSVELQGKLLNLLSGLKVNEVSSPVITREGINVFKLLKYKPTIVEPFDQVKVAIKKILKSQMISSRLGNVNQELSDLTYTNPETLKPAANKLNLPIQVSDWVSIDKGNGVFSAAEIRGLAFSHDVLSQGNNSKVVTLKNGDSLVLRVQQRKPSEVKPLAVVRASIVQALKTQLAKKQAGKEALSIQAMLKKGASGEKVAAHFGLQWQQYQNKGSLNQALLQLGLITRYNLPASEIEKISLTDRSAPPLAVLQACFQSPADQKPSLGFTELKNGDYVITKILPANVAVVKASLKLQREQIGLSIEALHASMYFQMMLESMNKAAKISTYPELLSSVA